MIQAAEKGHVKVVEMLLGAGANIDLQTKVWRSVQGRAAFTLGPILTTSSLAPLW